MTDAAEVAVLRLRLNLMHRRAQAAERIATMRLDEERGHPGFWVRLRAYAARMYEGRYHDALGALRLVPVERRGDHRAGCLAGIDPKAVVPGAGGPCTCHVEPIRRVLDAEKQRRSTTGETDG